MGLTKTEIALTVTGILGTAMATGSGIALTIMRLKKDANKEERG